MIDPVEKPELIPFPSEPTRREIAAFSVIVARCGVPKEHFGRLTIDNINHADQGTGRKVHGPMTAELIFEDQAERIIQFKVFLEALCDVNQKPASMRESPMPSRSSFAQAAVAADEAAPASFYGDIVLDGKDNIAVSSEHFRNLEQQ